MPFAVFIFANIFISFSAVRMKNLILLIVKEDSISTTYGDDLFYCGY